MLKIGITGGIGSGKTTVCKLFELQNIPVFYADSEAKSAMDSDHSLIQQLKQEFGESIYSPGGSLNRSKLAGVVFNDKHKLEWLNAIVHPAVFRRFNQWAEGQSAPYVVKEAALLFESNSYKECDATVLVTSPLELKIQRVINRDSISTEEVLKRMERQLSDGEKEKLADHLIFNDETQLIIPQVLKLHQIFLDSSLK